MVERVDVILLRVVERMARKCTNSEGRARLLEKAAELRGKIWRDSGGSQ